MRKRYLAVSLIFLLVIASIGPLSFGSNLSVKETLIENYRDDRYLYPEYYNCYNTSETTGYGPISGYECNDFIDIESEKTNILNENYNPLDGLMYSPWPMQSHDLHHTGRSLYSTANTWDKIWTFETYGWAEGGPIIDKNGIIYIGAYSLNAIYPNGSLKWKYDTHYVIRSTPAIDEDGNVYFGIIYGDPNYLYALYPNGTLKWRHPTEGSIFSSPAIDDDGVIYYAASDDYSPLGWITALYPNGTLKWSFQTNHVIYSSPAIGDDDTLYCGCHDNNIYALFSDNGSLKWKFTTGAWVHGSPTIAYDGTIYIGSDDGYLYALYPNNGTMKWGVNVGAIRACPTLDKDGTIYFGVWEKKFYAIYPNGTVKWSFDPEAKIWGSSAALSDDNTLYFSTCDFEYSGGIEIIALYTDCTVKWRKSLDTLFSSPAINSDGTVYIGSCGEPGEGFLNAFGIGPLKAEADGPYYGLINTPLEFTGSSSGGYYPSSYHWDFGDTQTSEEQNPTHTYTNAGNYTVTLTVTDNTSNTSTDTTWAWIQESNTQPNKPTIDGTTNGNVGTSYSYTVGTSDPDENIIWYFIDWGDNTNTGWIGPCNSGTEITRSHSWAEKGTYIIKVKAKDPYNAESLEATLEVTMPRTRISYYSLFLRFLERFPFLEKLLQFSLNSSSWV